MSAYMERDALSQLVAWKDSPARKPLVIKGARQVGKTALMREFGQRHFTNVAYLSLERHDERTPSEYAELFKRTRDPRRLVTNLSLASGQPINPGQTLLVLDEVQDCEAALNSLKYFSEDLPELHVVCAGSLLGVALASDSSSFPVGKVSFLDLQPMTFREFLGATGDGALADYCAQIDAIEPIPQIFATRLEDSLKQYFATGGMPEAVATWRNSRSVPEVDAVLADLLDSYERDFAKHGGARMYAKVSAVWRSLPSQLARENKKFVYGVVREGARAREYEDAIVWLENAGLVRRVFRSTAPGLPASAYDDLGSFKVYCLDVGLLRRLSRLDASSFSDAGRIFSEFKGAFAENYALQALSTQLDSSLRYWSITKPSHEVDFLAQVGNEVLPIEVKSGGSIKSSSLRYYTNKFSDRTPLRVRLSLQNLTLDDNLLNIPLWMADESRRLIELARRQAR